MPLPNPGMNFTPFDPLPASDLNDIVENVEALADGSGLDNDAVTAAKMKYGVIRGRQGGNATDWAVAGTTNYDTNAEDAFLQVGVRGSSATLDATVTFPNAYTQKPVVICSVFGGNAGGGTALSANAFAECTGAVTTTTVAFRTFNTSGAQTNQSVAWLATGV